MSLYESTIGPETFEFQDQVAVDHYEQYLRYFAPGYGTVLFDTPCATIRVHTDNGTLLAKASRFNIRMPLTEEIFSGEFEIDQGWLLEESEGPSGKTVEIGNSIDVKFYRGDPTTGTVGPSQASYIFRGRVWGYEEEIVGHTPRVSKLTVRGWGDDMIGHQVGYSRTIDTIDNVIKWIVDPLVPGTISVSSVDASSTTITFDLLNNQMSMWDAVYDICTKNNWDFYVDNDRILHAFEIGSRTIDESFAIGRVGINYARSGDQIINSQRVIGGAGKTIGSDTDYTESATGWTTGGAVQASYYQRGALFGSTAIDPDIEVGAGTYVIRSFYTDGSGGVYIEKAISPAIDLSFFGILEFSWKYVFDSIASIHNLETSCVMQIDFKTDNSNYFTTQLQVANKARDDWAIEPGLLLGVIAFPGYRWVYGWDRFDVSFNLLDGGNVSDTQTWTVTGSPRWDDISAVRYTIISPLPLAGTRSGAVLKIDNMKFVSGHYYSFRQDSTSINQYGERRGQLIYDANLLSDTDCERVANYVIGTYKNPIPIFEGLETMQFYDVEKYLGSECTIDVFSDITAISRILAVEHNFDGMIYHMTTDLGEKYIPSPDKYLSDLLKFKDLATQASIPDVLNPAALAGFLRSPLGDKDVDMSYLADNLVRNPHFEIDTDMDYIPDSWTPSEHTLTYRSQLAAKYGQWSANIPSGQTLESNYFPINSDGGYLAEIWSLGSLSGSEATVSAYVVFYDNSADLVPVDTISICVQQSDVDWTRHTYVHDASAMAVNAHWGRVRLVGESGSVGFFDNIVVQRLVGTDGGELNYIRPDEWSTTQTDYQTIWKDTFNPYGKFVNYYITRIGADIKSTGDDHADLRIIFYSNDVPKDTWTWSINDASWQRYESAGSVSLDDAFGKTVTIEYQLRGNNGYAGYARNLQAWVNPVLIKAALFNPFDVGMEI